MSEEYFIWSLTQVPKLHSVQLTEISRCYLTWISSYVFIQPGMKFGPCVWVLKKWYEKHPFTHRNLVPPLEKDCYICKSCIYVMSPKIFFFFRMNYISYKNQTNKHEKKLIYFIFLYLDFNRIKFLWFGIIGHRLKI